MNMDTVANAFNSHLQEMIQSSDGLQQSDGSGGAVPSCSVGGVSPVFPTL